MISKKLSLLICLLGVIAFGQEADLYQQELDKRVRIPNSPEAAAFVKYGDYNVSLYSGVPNIAVPIHTFQGRETDLSLSLTYDATGIKVEQLATWAGLGWNLNAGGRITRRANGLPDDYIEGNYVTTNDGRINQRNNLLDDIDSYLDNTARVFPNEQAVRDYFLFLDDINKSFIDAQPDVFTVTAPGLSTTLVFDTGDNNLPKSLDNPRVKIEAVYRGIRGNKEITGWKIINENGAIYYFGRTPDFPVDAYETTKRNGSDETDNGVIRSEYVSSWMLTAMVSPNAKDRFEFDYYDSGYWPQDLNASAAVNATVTLRPFETFYSTNEVAEQFGGGAGYFISQQFLSSISHNGRTLAQVSRGNRTDIHAGGTSTRLASIDIFGHTGGLLREVTFLNNAYFNSNASNATDKRLKLNGMLIKDGDRTTVQRYTFEYDRPNSLPRRSSKAQDFAGYYNGANGNQHLFERYEANGGDIVFAGANRDPNSQYARIGMLEKITYPTGGSTVFEYEGMTAAQTIVDQVKVNDLAMSLHSSDADNNAFFLNADGSIPDDKYTMDGVLPKIKLRSFAIKESATPRNYKFDLYGSAPNSVIDAYIFRTGDAPIGDIFPTFDGEHFSDYLALGIEKVVRNKTNGESISLDPGIYAAILLMDELPGTANSVEGPQYGDIVFTVHHQETIENQVELDQGGLRIASIKNYTEGTNFANGKRYDYLEQNPRNVRPVLSRTKTLGNQTVLIRSAFQTLPDDRISYRRVREHRIKENGDSEGFTESFFFTDPRGLVPGLAYPYESNYFASLKGGTPRTTEVRNDANEEVSRAEYDYYETAQRPIKVRGLTVINDDKYLGDYIYIRKNPDNTYSYDHVTAIQCPEGGTQSDDRGFTYGGGTFCVPLPCLSFDDCGQYEGLMDKKYGGLNFKESFVYGAFGGPSLQRETVFLRDGSDDLLERTTETTTSYEMDTGYYLPVRSESVDSKGDAYRESMTYPSTGGNAYNALLSKNNLVEVVASKREKLDNGGNVEQLLSLNENAYFSSGQVVLPSTILLGKESTDDLEERVRFTYYPNGNLKEAEQANGTITTYLWGYDGMMPVAKIDNATYDQLNALSFNRSILNGLGSTDGQRRTELNKIRNALPEAMVTTYTYRPSVGITSMTDPKGYTIYYEYDRFNRLEQVKDGNGKLVEQYEYGYKGQ